MLEHAQVGLHPGMDGTLPASAVDFHIPPPFPRSVYSESAVITSLSWPSLTETAPAISCLVQRSTSLAVRGLRMLGGGAMKRPEDVQLSREEGEALLARLEANTLTAEDRRVLGKVLTFYFWLLFALREAKLSLKRVKALVFGEKPKKPKPPSSGGTPSGGSAGESEARTRASQGGPASAPTSPPEKKPRAGGVSAGA